MAILLFIDESGQDHRESPYEVLAGVAVEDRDLWNLVCAIQDAEIDTFGTRYSAGSRELKSKKLLSSKTFRKASQCPAFDREERRVLAKSCLDSGENSGSREITALAQAKLAYVGQALDLCAQHHCKVVASIIRNNVTCPLPDNLLRKDYCYMFERFFYYLEDRSPDTMEIVVFDELDKSRSRVLVDQMDRYFKYTAKGRNRASRVVPEPFFVHSDLTTGVQLADLAAYIISWGYRGSRMYKARRLDLEPFVRQVCGMRCRTQRLLGSSNKKVLQCGASLSSTISMQLAEILTRQKKKAM